MSSEIELLKQLRDITGAGMMDCKKYLQKASNNIDEAVKLMRSEEGIKADKKSSRIAAEGVVYHFNSDSRCILIEINSETDFVARSDDFISYVNECCKIILSSNILSEEDILNNIDKGFNEKFENLRKNAITKMGENIIKLLDALSIDNEIEIRDTLQPEIESQLNMTEGALKKYVA